MAEYWVGPSLRQSRPRWMAPGTSDKDGHKARGERHLARPLTPRRWRAIMRLADIKLHDIVFLARYASHIAALVLAVAVGSIYGKDFSAYLNPPQTYNTPAIETVAWEAPAVVDEGYLRWGALPQTIIPERPAAARTQPLVYEVQEGDNPSLIAARFGLQPSTVVWSNSAGDENPDLLAVGQQLHIPPVDGVLHFVQDGDSIQSIASDFRVDPSVIAEYAPNNITDVSAPLVVGQQVMVPGGIRPYIAPTPVPPPPAPIAPPVIAAAPVAPAAPTARPAAPAAPAAAAAPVQPANRYVGAVGCCRWPVQGRITQQPSQRHMALDIATSMGTPVVAADGGRIIAAGWDNTGYGWRVIVDHGNGLHTLYAHFSRYVVNVGDYVNKGDMVGRIGSSGQSTGPHLHFEVRRNGYRLNPWNWLP